MNKVPFLTMLLTLAISPLNQATTVHPETTKVISLSNRDINRVVCHPGQINDVFFSKDKAITVSLDKSQKNAFIKFLIKSDGVTNQYVTAKSEFYFTCDGEVYTIIGSPGERNAKTVHLSSPKKSKIEENIANFGSLPHEERVSEISVNVLQNNIPDSFSVKRFKSSRITYPNFLPGVNLKKLATYKVEGVGLKATKYGVHSTHETPLLESDFLSVKLGNQIVGITLEPQFVAPKKPTTLIVVERVVGQ